MRLFGFEIENLNETQILEKIKKFLKKRSDFFHIVSLNPEIIIISQEDREFKKVLTKAQIKIIDGVGIVIASRILGLGRVNRVTGVDLFKKLLDHAGKSRLRVLLIGGRGNLAESIADCYQKRFLRAKFKGLEGIKDIKKPKKNEEAKIFSIVADFKPHFVFVAFGSPYQEKWLWKHREKFKGNVCMGVGGGFDYVGGRVPRAPKILRKLGFEWLFRLIVQPWRAKRQLRLIKFCWLVLKCCFKIVRC